MEDEAKIEAQDKMQLKRVILMSCGSYNPPTDMHLRMFGKFIYLIIYYLL